MLKPKSGYAFIELEPLLKATASGIIISDGYYGQKMLRKKTSIGVVTHLSLYREGVKSVVIKRNKQGMEVKRPYPAYRWNGIYEGIKGSIVLIEDGVGQELKHGDETYFCIRLEHIVAILPEGSDIKAIGDDVPRCPRCTSPGVGNIIMYKRKDKYVCPQCQLTAEGDHVDSLALGSSAELDDLQSPERRIKSSKAFSYKGQGNRS